MNQNVDISKLLKDKKLPKRDLEILEECIKYLEFCRRWHLIMSKEELVGYEKAINDLKKLRI